MLPSEPERASESERDSESERASESEQDRRTATPRLNDITTPRHGIWCKICGITRPVDGIAVEQAGADALGVNCFPRSPRFVDPGLASEICASVSCTRVAVFVDPEPAEVEGVLKAAEVDLLQFHGDEPPEFCEAYGLPYLKAVRMQTGVDVAALAAAHGSAWGFLLDTYVPAQHGGTGQTFDWSLWPGELSERRLIVAGGLDPSNVGAAVSALAPFGVDAAGGVEDSVKGVKNAAKITAFVEQAHRSAGDAGRV